MPSSPVQMPSPCSELDRNSVPPESKPTTSADNMLKIQSLLNPSASEHNRLRDVPSVSPPPTPAYTNEGSSPATTPRPGTPLTPSPTKRQKLTKDAAVFVRSNPAGSVNYPPFECNEEALCLSSADRQQLAHQHEHFEVFPTGKGDQGLVSDYTRHIPYSSEKKTFFGKTGREAFEGLSSSFPLA